MGTPWSFNIEIIGPQNGTPAANPLIMHNKRLSPLGQPLRIQPVSRSTDPDSSALAIAPKGDATFAALSARNPGPPARGLCWPHHSARLLCQLLWLEQFLVARTSPIAFWSLRT